MTSQWRHHSFDFYEIWNAYLSGMSNFILIGPINAEIHSLEVNKWLWRKKRLLSHCDLDLWPKVTNFNRVRASVLSNRSVKTASKSVHPFGWNCVHKQSQTQTYTHTHTHKLRWKYNPSTILWRCND